MKRFAVLLVFFSLLLSAAAYAQFETVWLKVLENDISSVTFSHDSKWIMAWLSPNIQIFDVVSGELVNDKIPSTVQQPFFSLDDTHVYGVENNRIVFYNLETGLDESTALPFAKNITLFSVSKDQKYLLGATKDSISVGLGIWNLETGALIKYITIPKDTTIPSDPYQYRLDKQENLDIKINCDISEIYLRTYYQYKRKGSNDKIEYTGYCTNRIFDFNTLDSIGVLKEATWRFWLSNNCQILATENNTTNSTGINIFNFYTSQLLSNIQIGDASTAIKEVKFTSDDRYLVTATSVGSDLLSVWDVQTGKLLNQEWGTSWETLDVSDNMGYIVGSVSEKLIMKKFQTTGVTENPDSIETLYPNPTSSFVTLSFSLPQSSMLVAKLSDNTGTNLAELFNSFLNEGLNTLQLDISPYASGTYYLRLSAGNYSKMFKVIITK